MMSSTVATRLVKSFIASGLARTPIESGLPLADAHKVSLLLVDALVRVDKYGKHNNIKAVVTGDGSVYLERKEQQ